MGEDNGRSNGDDLSAHDDSKKSSKHVRICEVSSDGWLLYCDTHGVSLTAMMDALGHVLGEMAYEPDDVGPKVAQATQLARRIDVARRRRPR